MISVGVGATSFELLFDAKYGLRPGRGLLIIDILSISNSAPDSGEIFSNSSNSASSSFVVGATPLRDRLVLASNA